MDAVAGVQESLKQTLQQQTANFQDVVAKANAQMVKTMEEFNERVNGATEARQKLPPEPDVHPEVKFVDGGVWFNADAARLLMATLEQIGEAVEVLQEQQK